MGAGLTAFDSVDDGHRTLHSGDVLRLATKPVVVGRALHFIVGQVSASSPGTCKLMPCTVSINNTTSLEAFWVCCTCVSVSAKLDSVLYAVQLKAVCM